MKEIFIRDKKAAAAAAEAAVLRRFHNGLTENEHQNVHGGAVMHRWTPDQVPKQDELDAVILKRKVEGTWIDKARKHVNVTLGGGLTAVVKNPKKVFDEVRYVGDREANAYLDLQSERGPSRKDLRVGQRVRLDEISLERRRTYKLSDKTGVHQLSRLGVPFDAATSACSGVIINSSKDFKIQTGLKYLPGQKITNYICYPGGGSWIRWDATKEVTYEWTDRIIPTPHKEGNTLEDINVRMEMILYELKYHLPVQTNVISGIATGALLMKTSNDSGRMCREYSNISKTRKCWIERRLKSCSRRIFRKETLCHDSKNLMPFVSPPSVEKMTTLPCCSRIFADFSKIRGSISCSSENNQNQ
eukprot:595027-Hanusia_phi.AAC.1